MSDIVVTRDKKNPTELHVKMYYTPIFPMKPYVKRPYRKMIHRAVTRKLDGKRFWIRSYGTPSNFLTEPKCYCISDALNKKIYWLSYYALWRDYV